MAHAIHERICRRVALPARVARSCRIDRGTRSASSFANYVTGRYETTGCRMQAGFLSLRSDKFRKCADANWASPCRKRKYRARASHTAWRFGDKSVISHYKLSLRGDTKAQGRAGIANAAREVLR